MFIEDVSASNIDICKEVLASNLSEETKVRVIQSLKNEKFGTCGNYKGGYKMTTTNYVDNDLIMEEDL